MAEVVTSSVEHGAPGRQGPRASRPGMMDGRLVRRAAATRWYLVAGVTVGVLTALLTLGQAWLISQSVTDVFHTFTARSVPWAIAGLAGVFAGKAALAWLNQFFAQRAAAAVKSQLRVDIMRARLDRPLDTDASSAALVTLVTTGLDALDGFYSKYLPQLVLAVTVPVIVAAAILTADLTSAIIVALTLPLIPIFMMLVGWSTEARTKRRWGFQTKLANYFADLVAGLPTLQVFGRAKAQAEGLRRTEAAHRRETMATLRISFLSALVLELLSTLSVAIVAVTIGLRVVASDLDLATALFVLVLAPEAYLPLRQVGAHYHDSADGMAAAASAFAFIDGSHTSRSPAVDATSVDDAPTSTTLISLRNVSHTYPGSDTPALVGCSCDIRPGEFVAITGPSGGGKTTALNIMMGFVQPTSGQVWVKGKPLAFDRESLTTWRSKIAYVGQQPGMIHGTIADNLRMGYPAAWDYAMREALDHAGAPELSLDHRIGDDGEGLSAGERRRVAMARALLRITLGRATLLLLDEPTAGLDAEAESTLLDTVRKLGVAVVVVSHRPAVLAEADRVLTIGEDA